MKDLETFFQPITRRMPDSLLPFGRGTGILDMFDGLGGFLNTPQRTIEDGKYILKFPLPGVKKDDVKVRIVGENTLVVSHEEKVENEETKSHSSHVYSATIPQNAAQETASAKVEDGMLTVTFEQKEEEKKEREITIDRDLIAGS